MMTGIAAAATALAIVAALAHKADELAQRAEG